MNPKTNNTIDEFQLFKSVLTYSIDNSNHESNRILELIGLNSKVFFENGLYCAREKSENQISKLINSSDGLIKVFGNPGTGKTTIVSKVLKAYETNSIIIKVDFKKIIEVEKQKFHDISELISFVETTTKNHLIGYCNDNDITRSDIIDFFIQTTNKKYKKHIKQNGIFNDTLSELKDYHARNNLKPKHSFIDWRSTWQPGDFYNDLWKKLYKTLASENLAYFLKNDENAIDNIIVFFDNIDSIFDDRIRDNFCNAIKKIQSKSSDSIITVVSLRSNNPSLKELKDNGTFKSEPIYLDYKEFLKKDFISDFENKYPNRKLTGKEEYFLYKKHYSIQNEAFANRILKARVNFIKAKLKKELLKVKLNDKLIDKLESLFFTLLKDNRLGPSSSDLSNYDRREGIELLVDFAKYLLHNKVNITTADFNQILLESHFYFWIAANNIVFDDSLQDIYEVVQSWKKNDEDSLGCSKDHLLLSLIANETDPASSDLDYDYSIKTTVSRIVKLFKFLQIKENEVKRIILRLYKKKDQKLGLIELSEFYGIDSIAHIDDELEIWLTPRGINYNMFSSLKFSYLLSILCKHNSKKSEYFWPNDPLNEAAFKMVLNFLKKLAVMHVFGLIKVKSCLNYTRPNRAKKYWYQFFDNHFCNSTSIRRKSTYNFNFSNLIRSHQAFIKKLINSNSNVEESLLIKIHGEYDVLKSRFETIVKELIEDTYTEKDLSNYFGIENRHNNV